ncbi:MAG: SDR family NAD(P)-dependent oxidoreductase [Planctomycetota bacterium]
MDFQLAGKVVLITGAGGGIGRALASAFADEGAALALHANKSFPALESWLRDQTWRDRALAVRADVTRPAEIAAAMEKASARFGRVDVCIANAGMWTPEAKRLHEADEDRIRKTIDTNLFGALWTARAFFAALARSGPRPDGHGASLVMIGSTAGRFGERMHAEYSVSKAGLYGLLRSLKNEIVDLDPYARVNLIEPGWTVTHMARPALEQPGVISKVVRTMPLRQLGRAVDVARAALFLASPAASRHVSGEIITVAGGMEGRSLWESSEIDERAIRRRLDE